MTRESLSAAEEEATRFIESSGPLQRRGCPCLSALDSTALPPARRQPEAGLAGADQRAVQLITSDSGQEEMLTGGYRNREKRTALLPSVQGCPEESFLRWLPPGHSACPSPSHQSSWLTDQQAKEDPVLLCVPLFLLICFLETLIQREMVADVHYRPKDKKEKVQNHKG